MDVWQTIRGEVLMGRSDPIVWLTREALERELDAAERYEDWWHHREEAAAALGIVPEPRRRRATSPSPLP